MDYTFDWTVISENAEFILKGLRYTVGVTLASMAAGLALGLVVAVARMSSKRTFRWPAYCFIEAVRSMSMLVALWWVYLALPVVVGVALGPLTAVLITFTVYVAAFTAELYRAGLESIPVGQREAALSCGMSDWQVFKRVLLPQGLTKVIPPIGSIWIAMFKDSALVFVVTLPDIMYRAMSVFQETYRAFEIFTFVFIVYFILAWPQARFVDWLYERTRAA